MKKLSLSASAVRIILIIILVAIIGLSVGGFYLVQDWLRTQVYNLQKNSSSSTIISNTNPTLIKQQTDDISSNQIYADKAIALVASSVSFENDIRQDINKYAQNTNITIPDVSKTVPDGINSVPSVSGVNPQYLKITLGNPVSYNSLLKFIKALETNIPKINLKGISIKSIPDSTDSVNVDPLTIEVFTR